MNNFVDNLLAEFSYSLPKSDLQHLQDYLKADLEDDKAAKKTLGPRNRQILGHHGEQATIALIRELYPAAAIEDANQVIRKNNPGFDIRVDGSVRIQSKGIARPVTLDMAAPDLTKNIKWQSDLWVVVNFGDLLDARFGVYSETSGMAPTGEIAFYIVRTDELRDYALRNSATARSKIWARRTYRGAKPRASNDHPDFIFSLKNRFDTMVQIFCA
tara:strand:- start:8436 stop:9080 length:645 start_codon:yes stop_codon:yes gene_type:complete